MDQYLWHSIFTGWASNRSQLFVNIWVIRLGSRLQEKLFALTTTQIHCSRQWRLGRCRLRNRIFERFLGWIVMVGQYFSGSDSECDVHPKLSWKGGEKTQKTRIFVEPVGPLIPNMFKRKIILIGPDWLLVLEVRFACQVEWVFLPDCYCPDTCQDFSCFHFSAVPKIPVASLLNFIK